MKLHIMNIPESVKMHPSQILYDRFRDAFRHPKMQICKFRLECVFIALVTLLILSSAAASPLQQALQAASPEQLAIEAENAFQRGLQCTDKTQGAAAFQDACVRYEQILRDYPEHANGALYYNLGNTYARLENIPRAILNYRRAQFYHPKDLQLRHNLTYLRTLRQDHFTEDVQKNTLQTIFFWHYDIHYQTRCILAGILATLSALLFAVFMFMRRPWLSWSLGIAVGLTLIFAISLCITFHQAKQERGAVILAAEITPRSGDGERYQNSTDAPLHGGTEVEILQRRGEWYEITIGKRITGWVPQSAIEEI